MFNTNTKDLKIGIAGVGMVGGALLNYFKKKGIEPIVYDPAKGFDSLDELNKADIVFVCVPTPYRTAGSGSGPTPFKKDGIGFDLSYVEKTCKILQGEKIVIIKSTVIPGTTEALQAECPMHKFLFNPEFLTEVTADQDMNYPDRQILGYTKQSYSITGDIMQILPLAPFEKIMPSTEAELVKYFGNNWFAVKVIFANQMYDLCRKLGVDYDNIKEAASADKRIGRSHLDVWHKGYRGYGGKCIPKDIRAMIQFADKNGVDMRLLRITENLNNELMKKQGIDDPEIYSKRE